MKPETDTTILAILGGIGAALTTTVVQGHTQNGATVYADGHVVEQNGAVWYPGNSGMTISCLNGSCTISVLAQPASQLAADYGALYPGEVQAQDVSRNAVGNVATYQFPGE